MDLSQYPLLIVLAGIAIVGLIFWYLATEVDRRKRNVGTGAIALVILLCVAAIYPPSKKLKGGIDLVGGSSFIVEIQPSIDENGKPFPVSKEAVQQVIATLSDRLNGSGLADNLMQPLGDNRLIVEMPGIEPEDSERVRDIIERTAKLELKEVHPQSDSLALRVQSGEETAPPGYKVYIFPILDEDNKKTGERPMLLARRNIVGGDAVQTANAVPGQYGVLSVLLTSEGGNRVRNSTEKMRKGVDRMAVVLDGAGLIAPVVQANLSRNFVIQGLDGQEEVRQIVFALNNPLRNSLNILSESSVTPRYGKEVIRQGITSAIAGLGLTLIFVLIYYRFAGIIALAGLCVNILILFGAMAMFGATFTLPGIAGIILTIGVAVDANVLIFERLREEMAGGKSLGNALKAAYEKAFTAIFDANITTLLTALILLWRASDQMKGFAITLTIGILSSMFAALLVTRVLFFWGNDTGTVKKLSFLNLIPEKTINFMDKRKIAFLLSGLLIIGSLITVGSKGNSSLGIDFLGGSRITIQLEEGQDVSAKQVTDSLSDLELTKNATAQLETVPNSDGAIITIKCAEEDLAKVEAELRKDIASFAEKDGNDYKTQMTEQKVDAALGSEFLKNSIMALGLGLLAVLVYISLRFEFSFAIGAFVALFHDIVICIGVVVLWGTELSLIHVGAFLTIAGYSINDTIVVFDRIRETLKSKRGEIKDVMNVAINATLSRTILTSLTTFVAVFVLFIFGGAALKDFSFAIMIGVIVGTYSSIFIAAPVVYLWSKARGSNLRQELLDANLEAAVSPSKKQSVGQLED
ncbi:protein translocase subunit SecF [Akkermansiaceae bacterium]|nr:protein translocase subunit SecF [Akkermansiaceae bacterium]MDB4537454.1 protein translocase subunit SecF [Akkermansiaceae bacterium]